MLSAHSQSLCGEPELSSAHSGSGEQRGERQGSTATQKRAPNRQSQTSPSLHLACLCTVSLRHLTLIRDTALSSWDLETQHLHAHSLIHGRSLNAAMERGALAAWRLGRGILQQCTALSNCVPAGSQAGGLPSAAGQAGWSQQGHSKQPTPFLPASICKWRTCGLRTSSLAWKATIAPQAPEHLNALQDILQHVNIVKLRQELDSEGERQLAIPYSRWGAMRALGALFVVQVLWAPVFAAQMPSALHQLLQLRPFALGRSGRALPACRAEMVQTASLQVQAQVTRPYTLLSHPAGS